MINVHIRHKAFHGRGEGAERGMDVGEEGESGSSIPPLQCSVSGH